MRSAIGKESKTSVYNYVVAIRFVNLRGLLGYQCYCQNIESDHTILSKQEF